MNLFAQLAQSTDLGFDDLEPVAVSGQNRFARSQQVGLDHGYPGPVELLQFSNQCLSGVSQGVAKGRCDLGQINHDALLRFSSSIGIRRTAGGPRMPSSRTATAIAGVIPQPISNGVQTVSKSSSAMTSR